MSVLVVAAHPDDEVLGCGATIARLVDEGDDVVVVILGEGETSRHPDRRSADHEAVAALKQASQWAADVLGISEVVHRDFPDNRFDSVALLDVVKAVEGVIDEVEPRVVFVQHGGDLNIDHQLTFRATLVATRSLPGSRVREVHAFEVPSSTDWSFQRFDPQFRPSYFVDVSATLDKKLQALDCYRDEMRPFPHPRSPEAVTAYATRWGSVIGCQAAEAFETIRMIK